jgi:5-methylcytosine-specific restriction enzyme A
MAWDDSTRSARLPANWPAIRARVLRRDRGICHVCGRPGADQVDHLVAGDDHSDANLAAIHDRPCHRRKSSAEGNDARARQRAQARRPPEPHPGARPPGG